MPTGVYKRTKEMNTGKYVRTNEHKRKISEVQIGKKLSDEHKQKISETLKKTNAKRKQELGYACSFETRKKISETKLKKKQELGYVNSPETRKKISETMLKRKDLGYVVSLETRKKMSESRLKRREKLGYIVSPEARRKQGKAISGVNNPNWNPNRGEVYAPYGKNFYNKNIRNRKRNLQNGRDMFTGIKLDPNKHPHYHHIDYCKSNDDPNNHCFISNSNHAKIINKQSNPIKSERYKKILQENTLALKNGQIPKYWNQINKELFRQEKLKQLDLRSYII